MKILVSILAIGTVLCVGILMGILLQKRGIPNLAKRRMKGLLRRVVGKKEFDYSSPVDRTKLEVFGEPFQALDPETERYLGSTKPEKSFMTGAEFLSYRYFWHFKEISDYLISDDAKEVASNLREQFWGIRDINLSDYLDAIKGKRAFFKEALGIRDFPANGRVKKRALIRDDQCMTIEKVELESRISAISVPLYIAGPKGRDIKGVVVAIHGIASVPEKVIGIESRDYTRQFGLELANQGYLVYAPYILNLQNKIPNISGLGILYTGNTHWSIELQKLLSVVDSIKNDPDLSNLPIAAYGISLGGILSLMLSAIDERIDITVSSGALATNPNESDYAIHNEINKMNYALLNNMDGVVLFRYLDYARLVYPRPLIIEMGALDNPTGDTIVWPEIKRIYERHGMDKNLKLIWFKGFHETVPELTIPAIDEFVHRLQKGAVAG